MIGIISLRISQTGTTQTAGARNKGGNFIGQLCISVVPHWPSFGAVMTWRVHLVYRYGDLSVYKQRVQYVAHHVGKI